MSTEKLYELVRNAEDAGQYSYAAYHDEFDIIEYVEIGDDVIYNEDYEEEVREAYWLDDSYRVADRLWRE